MISNNLNSNNSTNQQNIFKFIQNNPWKNLILQQPDLPGPRAAHSCEIIGKKLYLFGGWNGKKALNDLYIYNIENMKWTESEVSGNKPGLRNNHSTCTHGKYMYLHGGHNGEVWLDDLYIFDTSNLIWNKVNILGDQPSARACHTLSRVDKKIYMFGGYDGIKCYNDIEILDTENKTWSTLNCCGTIPLARNAHSISVVGKDLFLFGGHSGNKHLKDLFIFNTETATWYEPKVHGDPPEGLRGHTSTHIGNKIIIFGGYDGKGRSKELFMLNLEDMKWSHVYDNDKFPGSRQRHSSVRIDNKRILIFGGFDGIKWLNDIHILDVSVLTENLIAKNSSAEYQDDLHSLINNKDFADVIFKINENKTFYGHKAIIAKRSSYFNELFKNRETNDSSIKRTDTFINNSISEILIENIKESSLLNILEFIYTGCISTNWDFSLTLDLLFWSNEFRIKELKSYCENYLIYGMNSENVADILITSHKQGLSDLKTMCINYILSNFHEVSHKKTFYSLELYPSLLMEVMMLSLNKIESD